MNVEANKQIIENLLGSVQSKAVREQLSSDLETLSGQYETATDEQKPIVAERMAQLRRTTEIAAGTSAWSWFSIVLIFTITLLFFVGIFGYFWGIGPEKYSSIEATRPILVFTLIVAMLGFGGLLIVRALFAKDSGEELQSRYRLAREIFLVFAGIFGTIIGFYFGAADDGDSQPPVLGTPVFADGTVTAEVAGGTTPFIGLFSPDGQAGGRQMQVDGRTLSIAVTGACPADATILLIDGQGRQDEADLDCPSAGGTEPGDTNASESEGGSPDQGAAANNSADAAANGTGR